MEEIVHRGGARRQDLCCIWGIERWSEIAVAYDYDYCWKIKLSTDKFVIVSQTECVIVSAYYSELLLHITHMLLLLLYTSRRHLEMSAFFFFTKAQPETSYKYITRRRRIVAPIRPKFRHTTSCTSFPEYKRVARLIERVSSASVFFSFLLRLALGDTSVTAGPYCTVPCRWLNSPKYSWDWWRLFYFSWLPFHFWVHSTSSNVVYVVWKKDLQVRGTRR